MDKTERRLLAELVEHPGWEVYKARALGPDKLEDNHWVSLRTQVLAKLEAAGRKGDGIECAKFAGQLEIIPRILDLPKILLEK